MFGDNLKKLIKEKYDTYNDFARVCDVPKSTLSEVLNNRKLPREKNLAIYIKNLQPLAPEKEKELIKEWAFGKSNGKLRKEVEDLEKKNKNMLEVLASVKKERELISEVNELKQYEDFYNLFFKGLNSEQTKSVLTAILKELKIIALDSNKQKELKAKFEKLENIIDKIN